MDINVRNLDHDIHLNGSKKNNVIKLGSALGEVLSEIETLASIFKCTTSHEKLQKVPGTFTSIAGEEVNDNIEDSFCDSVHAVRVFRCVRKPQEEYKKIISLCHNENEGQISDFVNRTRQATSILVTDEQETKILSPSLLWP